MKPVKLSSIRTIFLSVSLTVGLSCLSTVTAEDASCIGSISAETLSTCNSGRTIIDQMDSLSYQAIYNNTAETVEDSDNIYNDAIDQIKDMPACNPVTDQYKRSYLDLLNWLAAWNACYITYYLPLQDGGTFGDVGAWLACITPVNTAIVSVSGLLNSIYYDAITTPCEAGYQPPDFVDDQTILDGQAYRAAQAGVAKITEGITTVQELRKKLAKGYKYLSNPERTGEAIVRLYSMKSTQKKIAESAVIGVVENVASNIELKLTIPASGLADLAGEPGPRNFNLEYNITTPDGKTSTATAPFTLGWKGEWGE